MEVVVNEWKHSTSLEVLKDPNSRGTEGDVRENFELVSQLQSDLNRATEVINGAERIRSQLQAIQGLSGEDETLELRNRAKELEAQFTAVEAKLLQLNMTGRGQDGLRWPSGSAQQIRSLLAHEESSDFPPTEQHRAVGDALRVELDEAQAEYDVLVRTQLSAFNAMLVAQGLGGVISEDQP